MEAEDNQQNQGVHVVTPSSALSSSTMASSSSSSSAFSSAWMKTKPKNKRKIELAKQDEYPPLPLDWTRVKRRRPRSNNGGDDDDNDDCLCPPPGSMVLDESSLTDNQELIQGQAVIFLPDVNPNWFQGYFFPDNSKNENNNTGKSTGDDDDDESNILKRQQNKKPWGLLAKQEELDDCLRCADGGYRVVTMTIIPFPSTTKKQHVNNIEWTGGDMMRLSGPKMSLEPTVLLTDERAVPIVERLFGDLLDKCRNILLEDEPCEVLDLFPDVAIISGPMKFVFSKNTEKSE